MRQRSKPQVTRVALVGAGPANLSLAALLRPFQQRYSVEVEIFESEASVSWHPGQLLPGAELQSEWYRDLVTPVDPTSQFSFLNYLKHHGRIMRFFNSGIICPSRKEFQDYLQWVASNLDIEFGFSCSAISKSGGRYNLEFDSDRQSRRDFDYVSLGVGRRPLVATDRWPISANVMHSSSFASKFHAETGDTVVVVGGGQSGAEIFGHLLNAFDTIGLVRLYWVTRGSAFFQLDTGYFIRELYTLPIAKNYMNLEGKDQVRAGRELKRTASGVSEATMSGIYRALYEMSCDRSRERDIQLLSECSVTGGISAEDGAISVSSTGLNSGLLPKRWSKVILCTGFSGSNASLPSGLTDNFVKEPNEFGVVDGEGLFIQSYVGGIHFDANENFVCAAQRNARIVNSILGDDVYSVSELDRFMF